MTDDLFADLDALLTAVTTKAKLAADRKAAKATLSNHRATPVARAYANESLRAIDEQLDAIMWLPTATVALFAEQHCNYCGSVHRIFLQFMEKSETARGHKVTRLHRIASPRVGLPKLVQKQVTKTHFCADCCSDFKFDLGLAEERYHGDPFAVSGTYEQVEEAFGDE